MSFSILLFQDLLRASDESQLVDALKQQRPSRAKITIAPEIFLDLLLVKAETLAFSLASIHLIVMFIRERIPILMDFEFARANTDLLRRICDFLFLTLLPRNFEICKMRHMTSYELNSEISNVLSIFEEITQNVVAMFGLDPKISCSCSIIKVMMEALFQIVNDFDGDQRLFRGDVSHGVSGRIIRALSMGRDSFGINEDSDWYFFVFEILGQQLTQAIEHENTEKHRIERVATVVVEVTQRFVPTCTSDEKKQEENRLWPRSSVACAIAHNKQYWQGIRNFLRYASFNFKSNDTSSLLTSLVEFLSVVVPASDDVSHLIADREFVRCITSYSFVHFVLEQNRKNANRQPYEYYAARNSEYPDFNDTLTHYLTLLSNIAKVNPQSFTNLIVKDESGVLERMSQIFDAVADGRGRDINRNLSTTFLWFGLIVDDVYKNGEENVKNITCDDIVLPMLEEVDIELDEDQQGEQLPQPPAEKKLPNSHPFAAFITHFCNTVMPKSLNIHSDFYLDEFNIFHAAVGLDALLRNLFPAGKRITWPDLAEATLGARICNFRGHCIRARLAAPTATLEYVVEISRVLNRLNEEYLKDNYSQGSSDNLPSFYFQNSLQFARFLISHRDELCEVDRLEILKLIASVVDRRYPMRDASMWAKTEGECEQIFLCLMRLIELSVRDSIVEFELTSRILWQYFDHSFLFDPRVASTLWSLGRTLRRMDGGGWSKAFLAVLFGMDSLFTAFVEEDDVLKEDFFAVLAELLPLIVSTTTRVLKSSSSSSEAASICYQVIVIAWKVFAHATAQNPDVAATKDDKERLSVFYEPEFASMLIIMLEAPMVGYTEAMKQCCELLVGLRQRCDSLNKSMDAIVKNDRIFGLLHAAIQESIESDSHDAELLDVYQQVCTIVFKKNEDEMMKPQRREREEDDES